jgi:hypothetical protein
MSYYENVFLCAMLYVYVTKLANNNQSLLLENIDTANLENGNVIDEFVENTIISTSIFFLLNNNDTYELFDINIQGITIYSILYYSMLFAFIRV